MGMAIRLPRTGGLKSFEHALYDPRCTGEVMEALCFFADRAAKGRIGFVEGFPFDNLFFTTLQAAGICEGVRLYRHARRVEESTVDGPARVGRLVRDLLARKNWSDYLAAESTLTMASGLVRQGHAVELVPEHRLEKRPDLLLRAGDRSVYIEMKAMHANNAAFEDFSQRLTDKRLLPGLAGDIAHVPDTEAGRIALVEQIADVVGRGGLLTIPALGWVAPANESSHMFVMGRVPCDRCRLVKKLQPNVRNGRLEEPDYGPRLNFGDGVKVLVVRTGQAFFGANRDQLLSWFDQVRLVLRTQGATFSVLVYEDSPPLRSFRSDQDGVSLVVGVDPDDGYGRIVAVIDNPLHEVPKLDVEERRALIRALVLVPTPPIVPG